MQNLVTYAPGIGYDVFSDTVLVDGHRLRASYSLPGGKVQVVRVKLNDVTRSFDFVGGFTGGHSLAADQRITSRERLVAHWRGFIENTDEWLRKNLHEIARIDADGFR